MLNENIWGLESLHVSNDNRGMIDVSRAEPIQAEPSLYKMSRGIKSWVPPITNSADEGNLGFPQLPGQGYSFHSFRTNTYKLSFMESPSGIKVKKSWVPPIIKSRMLFIAFEQTHTN
ncbi:hypothetical protein AMTRI_Chr01g137820 [Amborella trichopoda]